MSERERERERERDSADDGFSTGACGRWFLGQTR